MGTGHHQQMTAAHQAFVSAAAQAAGQKDRIIVLSRLVHSSTAAAGALNKLFGGNQANVYVMGRRDARDTLPATGWQANNFTFILTPLYVHGFTKSV
jgi:hypothetical protein